MGNETLLMAISDEIERKPGPLSPPEDLFRLIWELEAQVNNGGFHQYFYNTTGGDAAEAVTALRTIGAMQCAELLTRALAIAQPDDIDWQDQTARREHLEFDDVVMERLCALDEAFYQYPDDLSELLTGFVMTHPDAFPVARQQ